MSFKHPIFFLLAVLIMQSGSAQGGATIKTRTDKQRILIGEPFVLTIEASMSRGSSLSFPIIDTIPHFEILGDAVIDSSGKDGGIGIIYQYKLTSFDSGRWAIPSYSVAKGGVPDSILIDVVFTDNFDTTQAYHDIKDILEVKARKKKQTWWWYVSGGLVIAAVVIYLARRKKPVAPAIVQPKINPFDQAMRDLDRVRNEQIDPKIYHTRLVEIFRLYLFRRKGILSLQKTTDDLVIQLRSLEIQKEQYDRLTQSLRLSDFVKFAKYIPTTDDNNNVWEEIKNAIVTIEKNNTVIGS